jgi:hypothetical protein
MMNMHNIIQLPYYMMMIKRNYIYALNKQLITALIPYNRMFILDNNILLDIEYIQLLYLAQSIMHYMSYNNYFVPLLMRYLYIHLDMMLHYNFLLYNNFMLYMNHSYLYFHSRLYVLLYMFMLHN